MKSSLRIESQPQMGRIENPVRNSLPGDQVQFDNRAAAAVQRQLQATIANSPRFAVQRQMSRKIHHGPRMQMQRAKEEELLQKASANSGIAQFAVLTRSMWKIVNETTINSEEEYNSVGNFLKSKGYGDDVIKEILKRVVEKSKKNLNADVFSGYSGERKDVFDDSDEIGMNMVDHGDLNEYDNPTAIDNYLKNDLGIVQMARKGNTVSGPKDYSTNNFGDFKKVAYTTDAKGSIDFTSPTQTGTWSNPVYGGSLVDLSHAGKTIDKKNRPQHFALGDYLYAKRFGKKASATTNLRKGKWTWHHLPTQYQMVLVDMTVHAKHGHNGGVYLW